MIIEIKLVKIVCTYTGSNRIGVCTMYIYAYADCGPYRNLCKCILNICTFNALPGGCYFEAFYDGKQIKCEMHFIFSYYIDAAVCMPK